MRAQPSPDTVGRWATLAWYAVTAALIAVAAVVAHAVNPQFFYLDDTPGGAVGQWYELGQQLWAGTWPMLNLEAGMAGQYLMEQWGLLNPPTLLIALLSVGATDLAVFTAAVKTVFLMVGGCGVHYLARTIGAAPRWAALAGVSAALAGFTWGMDATTWVTQLMVWAWSGWAYGGLLRWVHRGGGLVAALGGGFLVITVGYVHGTLYLILFMAALLLHAAVDRHWRRVARVLGAGVVLGLVTVMVYLPALLSSGVTVRETEITNSGFMTLTLNGLAVAAVPLAQPDLAGWWGRYALNPLTYIAWFLPLLVLVPARTLLAQARARLTLVLFAGLLLLVAVGPSDLALFRFPARAVPWLAMVLLVWTALSLTRVDAGERRPHRVAVPAVVVLTLAGHYLAWAGTPETGGHLALQGVVLALAIGAAAWAPSLRAPALLRRHGLFGVVALTTCVVAGVQTVTMAQTGAGFGKRDFPADTQAMASLVPSASGTGVVVGDPWQVPADQRWDETATGNLWYLVDHVDMLNLYSPTGFTPFNDDLCMSSYYGATCFGLVYRLFETDADTGAWVVDLLGVDTIQLLAVEGRTLADLEAMVPPPGWRQHAVGDASVTWVREAGAEPAASGVWETPGLRVRPESADDLHVTFTVEEVPAAGGRLVLPRVAWPGYRVDGGTLAPATRGYLLTVDVPAGTAPGATVEVTFRPPGWRLQIAAFVGALLAATALGVWGVSARRRAEGDRVAGQRDNPGATPDAVRDRRTLP
ncbi:MAG: hypothetical protein Q4F65_00480 [Propionibacteriaceae bacterium]|nr:hypothetical protein [Propionibacteriaceae bacterium]